jgi:hypothetical protein
MKKSPASVPRFTRVELENWRNFIHVSAPLQRRAFLVGANASGKSNFLKVFRFLRDICTVGGGFQAAVANEGGIGKLRCLFARRKPDVRIRVDVGTDDQPDAWTYELQFSHDHQRRPVLKREFIARAGRTVLERPDRRDKKDPQRMTQTYLEQVNVNREFRGLAEFFAAVHYLHVVPQLMREPDRFRDRRDDPYGGDFLEQVARVPPKTRKAWLRRIRDALRVAVPQLEEFELWRDPARGTPHWRARFQHWRPHGAWQSEGEFSDGTLRLLGLLWATLDGWGPLLLEEPELSLHPEVVRRLPQMFARMQARTGRQVLISTHSAEMLTDEGIGLDEILLLIPGDEGTLIRLAKEVDDVRALASVGLNLSEALLPHTRPEEVEQLTLFGK